MTLYTLKECAVTLGGVGCNISLNQLGICNGDLHVEKKSAFLDVSIRWFFNYVLISGGHRLIFLI